MRGRGRGRGRACAPAAYSVLGTEHQAQIALLSRRSRSMKGQEEAGQGRLLRTRRGGLDAQSQTPSLWWRWKTQIFRVLVVHALIPIAKLRDLR